MDAKWLCRWKKFMHLEQARAGLQEVDEYASTRLRLRLTASERYRHSAAGRPQGAAGKAHGSSMFTF